MKQFVFLLVTAIIIGILLVAFFGWILEPTVYAESNNSDWQVSVTGLVENPMNLTLNAIEAMPQTTEYAQLWCVDGELIDYGNWTGVQLSYLLQLANVSTDAIKVAFFASDGFSTDLPIPTAEQSDIVLAYALNGIPLPEVLRLVVPNEYGYKWIDMVTNIQLVNSNYLGTYETQGYSDSGLIPASSAEIPEPSFAVPSLVPSLSPSLAPSFSPSPTSHYSTTPSPTLVTPTAPMINYTFTIITVIAILIATATAAVILRKNKQTKNKKLVQTASSDV